MAAGGRIGVGIIGAGWFGARHAVALAQAGGFELVGACRERPSPALDAFVAAHGGIAHPDAASLLADPRIGAVVIATPHHTHAALACQAARAGKAILLEKPMAPDLAQCDAIAAAVAQAGVPFLVGHTQRFAAPLRAAHDILRAGELGRVRYGASTMVKLWMEANRQPWHLNKDSGGGMLLTAGIHALDRLLWLMDAAPVRVAASGGSLFHDQEADDTAVLLMRFADGAAATVASVAYRDGAPFGGTELVCERGTMLIDPGGGVRIGQGGVFRDVRLDLPADVMGAALAEEWRALHAMITRGAPSPVSAASARRTIATIAAALESMRSGAEARVDDAP